MKKILALVACLLMLTASNVMAQTTTTIPFFCKGDFNYNGSVAAEDITVFLNHFGRSQFNNPCPPDGPTPPPKTGQTTSYATGDDGDFERGVPLVTPRFTDNLDGTVTDNQTGLIWMKNANCFGDRPWHNALSDCNGLANGSCGLNDGSNAGDWRLPNSNELASLIHKGYYNPALSNTVGTGQWTQGNPFNNVRFYCYWSSSTSAYYTEGAWYVDMGDGLVWYDYESFFYYVWCVRAGH